MITYANECFLMHHMHRPGVGWVGVGLLVMLCLDNKKFYFGIPFFLFIERYLRISNILFSMSALKCESG